MSSNHTFRPSVNPQPLGVFPVSKDLGRVVHIDAHYHECFELLCVSEGHTEVVLRGRRLAAGPGDLLIYYPGETHEEFVQPGRFSYVCIRFAADAPAAGVSLPAEDSTDPVVHLPRPEQFQALFSQMQLEQQLRDDYSQTMVSLYLAQFAILLQRTLRCLADEVDPQPAPPERIRHAIAYIHARLDTDLSLTDLAEHVYMSPSHFSHTFKELTGEPPKQYLLRAKIAKARELLEATDQSVKSIAAALGYDDPKHFSRLFRKYTHQTPSAYRRGYRSGPVAEPESD